MNEKLGTQVYESFRIDEKEMPTWDDLPNEAREGFCNAGKKLYHTWQTANENSQIDWLVSQLSQNARAVLFYLAGRDYEGIVYSKAISEHFQAGGAIVPRADLSLLMWYELVRQDFEASFDNVTMFRLTPMGSHIGNYLRGKFGL